MPAYCYALLPQSHELQTNLSPINCLSHGVLCQQKKVANTLQMSEISKLSKFIRSETQIVSAKNLWERMKTKSLYNEQSYSFASQRTAGDHYNTVYNINSSCVKVANTMILCYVILCICSLAELTVQSQYFCHVILEYSPRNG